MNRWWWSDWMVPLFCVLYMAAVTALLHATKRAPSEHQHTCTCVEQAR